MKSVNITLIVAVATASIFFFTSVQAQQTSLSPFVGIDNAQQICGPKISPDDLRGKVVFVEYWGTRCGPCRQSMPHLQEMYSQFEKTGLFCIIGNHIQPYSPDTDTFLKKVGVTFPIYQQLNLPINQPITSIPHAFLFDVTGKIVAQGHPTEVVNKIPALIQETTTMQKTGVKELITPGVPEEFNHPISITDSNIPQDGFGNIYPRNSMTGKGSKFSKGGSFQRSYRGAGRF